MSEMILLKGIFIVAFVTLCCVAWHVTFGSLKRKEKKKLLDESFAAGYETAGVPIVQVRGKDGRKLNFIIDTGCAVSCIDNGSLEYVEHEETGRKINSAGLDGKKNEEPVYMCTIYFRDCASQLPMQAKDLGGIIEFLNECHGVTVHGIIGSDYMNNLNLVVDFISGTVYTYQEKG